MVAIASPVFKSGPQDNISMVDAYNKASSEVRNELTSHLSSFGAQLTESFGFASRAISTLGMRISKGELNIEDAAERIRGALKGSRSDLANLSSGLQNAIYSGLTGVVPGTDFVKGAVDLYDQVQLVSGNGSYSIRGDRTQVSSVLGFISDLTGKSVFRALDLGAEAALIGGLIGTVSSWGVPALVDSLMEGKDDQFKHSVYSRNAANLTTSNITMLEYYVDQGMANALTSQTPDFGSSYLSRYTMPSGATPDTYPVLHKQLVKVMDALDPQWLYTARGSKITVQNGQNVSTPQMVINLASLNRVSSEAKQVLMSDETTRTAVLAAGNFPSQDLIQIAKNMYPLIAI